MKYKGTQFLFSNESHLNKNQLLQEKLYTFLTKKTDQVKNRLVKIVDIIIVLWKAQKY
ncbi:MAG: hypothetical protein RR333_08160 [Bacteroidales bacterium]